MSEQTITQEQLDDILASLSALTTIFENLEVVDVPVEPTPVEPTPVEIPDAVAFSHNGINFYRAKSMADAVAGFKATYGSASKDNDNVDGYWYSASKNFNGASDLPSTITSSAPTVPSPVIPSPVTPSPEVPATGGTTTAGEMKLYPKNATQVGSGWVNTTDGLKWLASNRYLINDAVKTTGHLIYNVQLPAGEYEFWVDGRAAQLTSGRTDMANDVWVAVDGVVDFRKHYFNGNGQWSSTKAAEEGGKHIYNTFTIKTAGTYKVTVSGRSNHAEVRTFTLKSSAIK